jgi:F0F1-type ATP synthase assembly protein I
MSSSENLEPPKNQTVWAAFGGYDARARRPHEEALSLFKRIVESLGDSHDDLQRQYSASASELVKADEQVAGLQRQLKIARKTQALAGILSLVGAILIGFGVNYLTDGRATPGWAMLISGGLMQLGPLVASFLDRE